MNRTCSAEIFAGRLFVIPVSTVSARCVKKNAAPCGVFRECKEI